MARIREALGRVQVFQVGYVLTSTRCGASQACTRALCPDGGRNNGSRKCLNQDYQEGRMSERIYVTYKIIGSTMKAHTTLAAGKPT